MAKRGLTNKGERSRETYGENAYMGRRECMFVIERSPGDRDYMSGRSSDKVCAR